ncbi:Flagellar protein FliT [Marinospirillum celere]|uniref:Flagellar protein FliT n=1 Tax=Marinospirillum celere TaxID=1122252 RepID=A0A1I1GSH1_9GAMM|nr:flagellar protein FliT [Marinospirillum celere]SFC14441.1 Flagellar protein FliT [Marinospirillum celere]
MTKPRGSIAELAVPEALQQCLKATRKLLDEFAQFEEPEAEPDTDKIEKLTSIREQLIYQTFAETWSDEAVNQHRQELEELESLDVQLRELAQKVRDELHQKRSANQHNRKAVNAYGTAKGQFHR